MIVHYLCGRICERCSKEGDWDVLAQTFLHDVYALVTI